MGSAATTALESLRLSDLLSSVMPVVYDVMTCYAYMKACSMAAVFIEQQVTYVTQ